MAITQFWKPETVGGAIPDLEVWDRQEGMLFESLEDIQVYSHPRAHKASGTCNPGDT